MGSGLTFFSRKAKQSPTKPVLPSLHIHHYCPQMDQERSLPGVRLVTWHLCGPIHLAHWECVSFLLCGIHPGVDLRGQGGSDEGTLEASGQDRLPCFQEGITLQAAESQWHIPVLSKRGSLPQGEAQEDSLGITPRQQLSAERRPETGLSESWSATGFRAPKEEKTVSPPQADQCIEMYSISGLPWWLSGKESTWQYGRCRLLPASGGCPREGNGNPLQCSCLENPMDRGAWPATVPWGGKRDTT